MTWKVRATTITSSPGPMPAAAYNARNAAVPVQVATVRRTPMQEASACPSGSTWPASAGRVAWARTRNAPPPATLARAGLNPRGAGVERFGAAEPGQKEESESRR
ncbi:hypothetical protein GCM10018779_59190 [Streptomyces griseocarneus]|nr:hypothetical protein GCM10018779_59190 [Streptomyces griseocarneus]